ARLEAFVVRVVLVATADLADEIGLVVGVRDARLDVFIVAPRALLTGFADLLRVGPPAGGEHRRSERDKRAKVLPAVFHRPFLSHRLLARARARFRRSAG